MYPGARAAKWVPALALSRLAGTTRPRLLELRARALDHVGPLGELLADHFAELFGAAAGGLVADHAEALNEGRRRDRAIDRGVELHHHVARDAGRSDHAAPGRRLVAWHASLGDGLQIRECRRAPRA